MPSAKEVLAETLGRKLDAVSAHLREIEEYMVAKNITGLDHLYRMQKSLVALRFEGTKFAAKPKTLLEVFSGENAT